MDRAITLHPHRSQQGGVMRRALFTLALFIPGVAAASACAPPPQPVASCDPNYSPCVPVAFDVDCASGTGDGPAYIDFSVQVIGQDIYGLDRDGNGIGCENG
jgi:hypothetical protein